MKSNYFNVQIITLFMLSLIPWPGPTVFKISCPRDNARIVRKIIQNKWIPILEKYKVNLPIECPFHPIRDIFGPQQAAKQQHRPSQWTCGLCGKSFFEEKYLDMHFDNRHKGYINMAEDAVCLADYCDIMRCDVLITQDPKTVYPDTINTDIEIWREASSYTKALTTSGPREVAKYTFKDGVYPHLQKTSKIATKSSKHCQKNEAPEAPNTNEERHAGDEDKLQNSSNNVYWEDTQSDIRSFPWGLLCMIIMVLSLGICMCYYIIWVLFDTDDVSVASASMTDRSTPSPAHVLRQEPSTSADGHQIYTEDYYLAPDKDNEYIYVTYPPDLKRRLLE
ncbi:hypothetical protein BDFB_009094, partial [Asbolus verrucosus]